MTRKYGLEKIAEVAPEQEVSAPMDAQAGTVITCLSNCMYAQNPEKTCMLKNVSLNMSEEGVFECGQYSPQQAEMPVDPAAGQPAQQAPQQAQQPIGLDKQTPQ